MLSLRRSVYVFQPTKKSIFFSDFSMKSYIVAPHVTLISEFSLHGPLNIVIVFFDNVYSHWEEQC